MRLFAVQGFAETTVEEIADAADVSARTFFRYYAAKELVVFADENERRELWMTAFRSRPAIEPVLDSLCEAALVLADAYRPEKDFLRWRLGADCPSVATAALRVSARWEAAIATEVAMRLQLDGRDDPTSRTVAAASMGAWRAALRVWFANGGNTPLRGHVRVTFAVLSHLGGLTPGGRMLDVRPVQESNSL